MIIALKKFIYAGLTLSKLAECHSTKFLHSKNIRILISKKRLVRYFYKQSLSKSHLSFMSNKQIQKVRYMFRVNNKDNRVKSLTFFCCPYG